MPPITQQASACATCQSPSRRFLKRAMARRRAAAVGAVGPIGRGQYSIRINDHLAEELNALGMSAAELARALTGDTALRLRHFFGTSAEFWLNRQSLYELRLAEQRIGKTI